MHTKQEKGVALIIIFFIMVILISVVLSVAVLWYSEIKIIRNASGSVVSFYAADSGIEKVLYYDRKVLPDDGVATRGFCLMCASLVPGLGLDSSCTASSGDPLECECQSETPGSTDPSHGCDPDTCDDCTITFETNFSNGVLPENYAVSATVYPSGVTDMSIDATGNFGGVSRAINVSTNAAPQ